MANPEHDNSLAGIAAQLGTVRETIARQEQVIARQEQTIARLQDQLDQQLHPMTEHASEADTEATTSASETPAQPSRRTLLKFAGAAAAAAAAAGAVNLAQAPTAHANAGTSTPLGIDNDNTGVTVTTLTNNAPNGAVTISSTSESSWISALLYADASKTTSFVYSADTGTVYNYGLDAIDAQAGKEATAIYGFAIDTGTGVAGGSSGGFGVTGNGVVDLGAMYSGRFYQTEGVVDANGNPVAGPPTSGGFLAGEQIRDANFELWLCTVSSPNPNPNLDPGTWVRVAHTQPNYTGGAINFFAAPIRVIDTRSGQSPAAPLPATKAPLASGSTTTFQITGTSVGGVSVPAGARGVYANVTVVFPTNGGNLIFYPTGASVPNTSTLNYNPGTQVVGNFTIVGLNASGQVNVVVNGPGNTDVVVDIAGFIM